MRTSSGVPAYKSSHCTHRRDRENKHALARIAYDSLRAVVPDTAYANICPAAAQSVPLCALQARHVPLHLLPSAPVCQPYAAAPASVRPRVPALALPLVPQEVPLKDITVGVRVHSHT